MDYKDLDSDFNKEEINGKGVLLYSKKDYLTQDIDAWENYVKSLKDFDGNATNAAVLLWYFAEGVRDSLKVNIVDSPLPLAVFKTESEFPRFLSSDEHGLILDQKKLEEYSLQDYADNVEIKNNDEVTYSGKIGNVYRLGGAEESRHHWYREKNNLKGKYSQQTAKELGNVGYDATDIEFDGLEYQISYARTKNMGDETIGILESRYSQAKVYRENRNISDAKT